MQCGGQQGSSSHQVEAKSAELKAAMMDSTHSLRFPFYQRCLELRNVNPICSDGVNFLRSVPVKSGQAASRNIHLPIHDARLCCRSTHMGTTTFTYTPCMRSNGHEVLFLKWNFLKVPFLGRILEKDPPFLVMCKSAVRRGRRFGAKSSSGGWYDNIPIYKYI
ncbi:hypothetical protein OUZ56_032306 [Daphnia magna]|uniref:Uncharacterized protein n=1 Tax=Daphnia magna TaxID=35525 RepID=A0ABQ9ZWS4_9CRUS|nr:hypothetical protein OUZ56_032306 [Daphnia magna]